MATIQNLTATALTGASARPTRDSQKTIAESNLPVWADWLKFQTHQDPVLESAVLACRDYALAFKTRQTPRWITFLGTTGTGKSHCAKRLWNHLSARLDWNHARFIHGVIYWPRFVAELRSGNAYEKMRDMTRWPVLLVDDICAERDTTGFASEQLNMLLGCRENQWTIITSNKLLDQIGEVDPRMADRIIRAPNILAEMTTTSHSLR